MTYIYNKVDYVLGFAFDTAGSNVVLIKKTKPAWQAGRYNAVGGKIELNETPIQAMQREFKEETSVDVFGWEQTAILVGTNWKVYVFRNFISLDEITSPTEEQVSIFSVSALPTNAISNLKWLVPFNLDRKGGLTLPVEINYSK